MQDDVNLIFDLAKIDFLAIMNQIKKLLEILWETPNIFNYHLHNRFQLRNQIYIRR